MTNLTIFQTTKLDSQGTHCWSSFVFLVACHVNGWPLKDSGGVVGDNFSEIAHHKGLAMLPCYRWRKSYK
jgi:hypothetical protein